MIGQHTDIGVTEFRVLSQIELTYISILWHGGRPVLTASVQILSVSSIALACVDIPIVSARRHREVEHEIYFVKRRSVEIVDVVHRAFPFITAACKKCKSQIVIAFFIYKRLGKRELIKGLFLKKFESCIKKRGV